MKQRHSPGSDHKLWQKVVNANHAQSGMEDVIRSSAGRLLELAAVYARTTEEGGGRGRAEETGEARGGETKNAAMDDA